MYKTQIAVHRKCVPCPFGSSSFMVSIRYTTTDIRKADIFNCSGHMMVTSGWESACLSERGQRVLWLGQKSIYLAEQGGRSRPGLKDWVSGRLSPSALSQHGMRVLHHPTCSVTPAGSTGGKEQWGVALSTSTFLVAQPESLWFPLTQPPHINKRGSTLVIKAITSVHNTTRIRATFTYFEIEYVLLHFFESRYWRCININKGIALK